MGKGCVVAILGADGCGKSTVADLLKKDLLARGYAVRHQHWRPGVLPSPRFFIGQRPSADPTHPHQKSMHPRFRSLVLAIYYFADFWLGYVFQSSPFLRKGGIIVAERYIYDMIFDPRRHRLAISGRWAEILCRKSPPVHLIAILTGNPSVIHDRKKELTVAAITAQQEMMRLFFEQDPRAAFISTTDQSAEVCAEIVAGRLNGLLGKIHTGE